MYALPTVPLIDSLNAPVNQVWYADDAAATGKIVNLRTWWDGYHANASKTCQQLKQLDVIVRQQFVPNLTSRPPPSDLEMNLLSLPARLGGIGVTLPSTNSSDNFKASLEVTAPLRLLIESGINSYSYETLADQMTAKTEVRRRRREEANLEADNLKNDLPAPLQRAMDLAREKGSSS